uniref:C-type lectin domain-containing protein n=1 Tax=Xiphophorus couchianus TaxID=32473 RepID=A0A3B5MMI9_9TELE
KYQSLLFSNRERYFLSLSSVSSERHYHFIYEPKNWTDARSYCRETYTDLVTVDNQDVVTILNNMSKYGWIGLYLDTWKWSDGHMYGFQHWAEGKPDVETVPCSVATFGSSGAWVDWTLPPVSTELSSQLLQTSSSNNWTEAQSYCRQRYTDLVTVDSRCLDVAVSRSVRQAWIGLYFDVISWRWSLSDGGFYRSLWFSSGLFPGQTAKFFYISTSMNWTDAQSYCRLHYTDLASVRSLQENEQIRTARPAGLTVWIGLYKDTWKWSNGNLFLFSYWASGEPQGGVENCTVANFRLSGQWEDWPCGLEKTFVCTGYIIQ